MEIAFGNLYNAESYNQYTLAFRPKKRVRLDTKLVINEKGIGLVLEEPEMLRGRLETLIRTEWKVFDPFATVTSKLHEDGKIDFTVISEHFENMDGLQREAFFWRSFKDVPKTDLVRMTYGLLMTPEEAKKFSKSCMNRNVVQIDEWEE